MEAKWHISPRDSLSERLSLRAWESPRASPRAGLSVLHLELQQTLLTGGVWEEEWREQQGRRGMKTGMGRLPACCVQDRRKAHPRRCLRTLAGGCRKPKRSLCPTQYTCACAKSLQLCPTLCNPMGFSPPGSSVHGISQARMLE